MIGCSASLQLHNVGKRSIGGGMGQWRSAWVWKGGSQHSDPSHSFAVWRCREGLFLGGKGAKASVRRAPKLLRGWRTVAMRPFHSFVRPRSRSSPMHRFVSCGSSVPLFTHIFFMEVVRYVMRIFFRLMRKLTGRGFDVALTGCAYVTTLPATPRVRPQYVSTDFHRQKRQLAQLIDMLA